MERNEKRSFTLRLSSKENEELTSLKVILGESTDTGTIKRLIKNYPELHRRYDIQLERCKKLKDENTTLKDALKNYISSLEGIIALAKEDNPEGKSTKEYIAAFKNLLNTFEETQK